MSTGPLARGRRLVRVAPDLWVVAGLVLLTDLVVLVGDSGTGVLAWLRIGLGFAITLFVPGYALVSALFPAGDTPAGARDGRAVSPEPESDAGPSTDRTAPQPIAGLERAGLSVGLSVVVIFGVALAASLGPWSLGPTTLTLGASLVTLVALAVAMARRASLSPANRYSPPSRLLASGPRGVSGRPDRPDGVTVVLVVVLVLASAVAGYTLLAPGAAESFTEFSLLTEDASGALVLADGQRAFGPDGSGTFVVGIENREGDPIQYTVVVVAQRVTFDQGETVVRQQAELTRFTARVSVGEHYQRPVSVATPSESGPTRIAFLLYRGAPPSSPSSATAYRATHVWANASTAR